MIGKGNARYALLPLKHAFKEDIEAITDASWLHIEACALRLSVTCVKTQQRSGFCIIQGKDNSDQSSSNMKGLTIADLEPDSIGGMVLYLYAPGSAFELRLTNEMIDGGGVRPKEFTNGLEDYSSSNDTLETLEALSQGRI